MKTLIAILISLSYFSCTNTPAVSQSASVPQAEPINPQTHHFRSAEEMNTAGFRRYGVEKGSIYFRLEGVVKGTETIYFDNWGWREARHINTETSAGAFQEKVFQVQYLDGERRYDYDPATNIATGFESPQVQKSAEQYNTKDMVVAGIEMIKKMGGQLTGAGQVSGVECDIWVLEHYKTTLHMWQGLTMKEESFMMNLPVRRIAVHVKTNEDPPSDKLLMPEEAKIILN